MKTSIVCLFAAYAILISCNKESDVLLPQDQDSNNDSTTNNTTPANLRLVTGSEILYVPLPQNTVPLYATVYFNNGRVVDYTLQWSKISGPGTITFSHPDSLFSIASGLIEGQYAFEAKAVATNGGVVRDTQTVVVGRLSAQPNIIELGNYAWVDYWGVPLVYVPNIFASGNGSVLNRQTYLELQIKSRQTNHQWQNARSSATSGNPIFPKFVVWHNTGGIELYGAPDVFKFGDSLSLRIRHN